MGLVSGWEALGILGYLVLWFAYLPQIKLLISRKSSDDVSVSWLGILTFGLVLITVFSFTTTTVLYIIGNIISVMLCGFTLTLVVHYRRRDYE